MRGKSLPVRSDSLPGSLLIAVLHSVIHLPVLILFMLVLPMTDYGAFFTSPQSGLSLLGMWRLIAALLALLLLGEACMRNGRRLKLLLLVAAAAMIGHQVIYGAVAEASHRWSASYRIPRSIQDLDSTDSELRNHAIGNLSWYGADSRSAVPALIGSSTTKVGPCEAMPATPSGRSGPTPIRPFRSSRLSLGTIRTGGSEIRRGARSRRSDRSYLFFRAGMIPRAPMRSLARAMSSIQATKPAPACW